MLKSDAIDQLLTALSKAQGEFLPIKKTKTAKIKSQKGDYGYTYADLADVIDATTPALVKNGLSVTQPVEIADGHGTLFTHLGHASGQYMSTVCQFPTESDRMQEIGSRITYLRRYALSGVLGVCSEDDDDRTGAETGQDQTSGASSAPRGPAPQKPVTSPISPIKASPQRAHPSGLKQDYPPAHFLEDVPFDFEPPGVR